MQGRSKVSPIMTAYHRTSDGWRSEILTMGDTLDLPCIQCRLPVNAAYERTHLLPTSSPK